MHPYLIIAIIIPFFFVGFCCLGTYLLSLLGGWKKLSKVYPRMKPVDGRKFTMQRMGIGVANYILTIHSSREGLDLAMIFFLRCGYSPLFIPWAEIGEPRVKNFLWHKYAYLDIGTFKVVTLKMPQKAYDAYRSSY